MSFGALESLVIPTPPNAPAPVDPARELRKWAIEQAVKFGPHGSDDLAAIADKIIAYVEGKPNGNRKTD
jgi:hypothetical protein